MHLKDLADPKENSAFDGRAIRLMCRTERGRRVERALRVLQPAYNGPGQLDLVVCDEDAVIHCCPVAGRAPAVRAAFRWGFGRGGGALSEDGAHSRECCGEDLRCEAGRRLRDFLGDIIISKSESSVCESDSGQVERSSYSAEAR